MFLDVSDVLEMFWRIEACVERKYQATEFEGTPPGIVLRSIDFRG